MEQTVRHALPFIVPGQAQKEMTHNEALATIDLLLHARAETQGGNTPPTAPADGECHIVGPAPTGAWAGHAAHLAGWTPSGWRFAAPRDGMRVTLPDGVIAYREATAWRRVEPVAIGAPDADLQDSVVAIIAALQQHGIARPG